MTILVLFHTFGCWILKAFYLGWTCMRGSADFPQVLSYSRFVERKQQALSERFLAKGVWLVTRIKRNMKNWVMEVLDKLLLRQRAGMETINGMLKHVCQIEHTRRRSFPGFVANLCSGLIAYSFLLNNPKIHLANGSSAMY